MNDFVIPSIFNYFQAVSDTTKAASPKINVAKKNVIVLIEPRIELGTLCVLSICHNQLDHPTNYIFLIC